MLYLITALFASSALAESLTWDIDPATPGVQTGNGDWSLIDPLWWDGSTTVPWLNDGSATAVFSSEGATVNMFGSDVRAAGLEFPAYTTLFIGQYPNFPNVNSKLTVTGDIGPGLLSFSGKVGNGRYRPELLLTGLRLEGGQPIQIHADILDNLGSPSLQVFGEGTVVYYRGTWSGDNDSAITSLAIREGGKWVITDEAELDFIQSFGGYTRQLWVYGDGTGELEIEEGFVADKSAFGTVSDGIGAIRLSNAKIVTHHSQGLPKTYRRRCDGVAGPNGHFVFENEPGGIWRAETNPQSYDSAMWFFASGIVDAQVPITHTGVTWRNFRTCDGHTYTMANAFQTLNDNVTITKRGPETLTLEGEVAFYPGGILHVEAGGVDMRTNPAAGGTRPRGSVVGPNMTLQVEADAWMRFGAATSQLQGIRNSGEVVLEGALTQLFSPGEALQQSGNGKLVAHLGEVGSGVTNSRVLALGTANLDGSLQVERLAGYQPNLGTAWEVITANGGITGSLDLVDRTGLGLTLDIQANRIFVTSTQATATSWYAYDVWAADHFSESELADPNVSGIGVGDHLLHYALDLGKDGDPAERALEIVGDHVRAYINPSKPDVRTVIRGSETLSGEWIVLYDSEVHGGSVGWHEIALPATDSDRFFVRQEFGPRPSQRL